LNIYFGLIEEFIAELLVKYRVNKRINWRKQKLKSVRG
jgi:hypothetical protein